MQNGKLLTYSVQAGKGHIEDSETEKRIKAAINSGELRGTIKAKNDKIPEGPDKWLGVFTVTEPTEGLRKYVGHNESWIFTQKHELGTKQ